MKVYTPFLVQKLGGVLVDAFTLVYYYIGTYKDYKCKFHKYTTNEAFNIWNTLVPMKRKKGV